MDASDTLPNDIDALRALILAERAAHAAVIAERDKLAVRNERLEAIIAEIRRAHFGRKSERITDDQLALALDELETSLAKTQAEEEKADPALKAAAPASAAPAATKISITCRTRRWWSSPRARSVPAAAANCTSSVKMHPSVSTRFRPRCA